GVNRPARLLCLDSLCQRAYPSPDSRKVCPSGPRPLRGSPPVSALRPRGRYCLSRLVRGARLDYGNDLWRAPMFENLSDRRGGVLDRLTRQGALSEEDVAAAMREVRVALLEADVSLPVARSFVKSVTQKATGAAVTKSITPGQQVVKIVHDELIKVLQGEGEPDQLRIDNPPAPILMVGLQGSGKTTTTAKLAKRLKDREKKRVLLASLDTNRPAAMEQLAILGQQIGVDTLPIIPGENAVQIAKRARQQATLGGYDVYMLDTAGRLHIDEVLMDEVQAVRDVANPRETLLVVDGLT